MRCPDCHVEVKFQREYCPHCSAQLFGKAKLRRDVNHERALTKFWLNAGII